MNPIQEHRRNGIFKSWLVICVGGKRVRKFKNDVLTGLGWVMVSFLVLEEIKLEQS